MGRIDANVDVIGKILEKVVAARPTDEFCKSLQQQYFEKGGLSKKQLEGLLGKAQKFTDVSEAKLATLEAIIKKKHVTHRSEATVTKTEVEKDQASENALTAILDKYPQHKAAIALKNDFDKNRQLSTSQKAELAKFCKVLQVEIAN